MLARDTRDWVAAKQHFLAARDIFVAEDGDLSYNIDRSWGVLSNLGFVESQLGQLDTAAALYYQCLDALKKTRSRGYIATLRWRLARLEEQRGNLALAVDHAREALEWGRRLGMAREQAQAEAMIAGLTGAT